MRNLIYITILALFIYSPTLAKGNKKEKVTNSFKFNKELKGFESDYLTNKEFKTKVEKKQFWGILEIIVNFVASWFSTSYGKYTDDTKNQDGPYFIFDRSPNGLPISEQLQQLRNKIMGKDTTNTIIASNNYDSIYKTIFLSAKNGSIENCNDKTVCASAAVAKNAVFVYLVGIKIDEDGNFEYISDVNTCQHT